MNDNNGTLTKTLSAESIGAACSMTGKSPRKFALRLASDIRLWILVCLLIRLIGITAPPLETGHNWRQTLGTMVIRNFYEIDANILYPRIDIGGDKAGITGMEFPLFNYLGYLMSTLFGYKYWYGRLINLIVSSFGVYMFYRLIRDHLKDQQLAFYSTMVLLFSLWFSFSRKIMPDTFSMSLIITAIYLVFQCLTTDCVKTCNQWRNLLLFGVMATLGMLTKLPSGYLLPILAVPFFKCRRKPGRIIAFSVTSALCISITGIWYGCWVPYLRAEYGVAHFYLGTGFIDGLGDLAPHIPLLLKRFYETALKYVGFVLSLGGLAWAVARRNRQILTILLCCFPFFAVVILVSGYNFAHHNYYIIPYIPVMSLLAGAGLKAIRSQRLVFVLMVAVAAEGLVSQLPGFRVKGDNHALLALESDLDSVSARDELIGVNGSGSPTAIYFAHRRGWSLSNEEILDAPYIRGLQRRGLKVVVILNKALGATPVRLDQQHILKRDAYTIYRVSGNQILTKTEERHE